MRDALLCTLNCHIHSSTPSLAHFLPLFPSPRRSGSPAFQLYVQSNFQLEMPRMWNNKAGEALKKRRKQVEGKTRECQYCPKNNFSREYDVIRHEATCSQNPSRDKRKFKCNSCKTRTSRSDAAKRHADLHDRKCASGECAIQEGPHEPGSKGTVSSTRD